MSIIDFGNSINELVKVFAFQLCTYIIYIKIINFKKSTLTNKLIIIVVCIFLSYIYIIINQKTDIIIAFSVTLFLYSLIIKFITVTKFLNTILIILFTNSICALLLTISSSLVVTISMLIFKTVENNLFDHIASSLLLIIFADILFKTKKFRHGLYFFQRENIIENISIFGITFSCVMIYTYYITKILSNYDDVSLLLYPFMAVIIIGICMFIWIKKSLDIQYKIDLRDKNNQSLTKELEESNHEKEKLLETIHTQGKINHELNHKIKVLNNVVEDMAIIPEVTQRFKNKYKEDFDAIINEVKNTSNTLALGYAKKKRLPKTKLFKIDSTLEQLQLEAISYNINFKLQINGKLSINYIVEEILSAAKFATLLSDHIKNAIIAIQASNRIYKAICVILGEIGSDYGILIYDSGTPFDKSVLLNLGKKPITSHANNGGTGYGFMTTFETLKNINASLFIEEFVINHDNYTKSVGIIFDHKNEFRIKSYRYKELKSLDNDNYIVFIK